MKNRMGMTLLGIWLVVTALMGLLTFGFPYSHIILSLLALVAGILILAGR